MLKKRESPRIDKRDDEGVNAPEGEPRKVPA